MCPESIVIIPQRAMIYLLYREIYCKDEVRSFRESVDMLVKEWKGREIEGVKEKGRFLIGSGFLN